MKFSNVIQICQCLTFRDSEKAVYCLQPYRPYEYNENVTSEDTNRPRNDPHTRYSSNKHVDEKPQLRAIIDEIKRHKIKARY